MSDGLHRAVWDDIPWYVNGTLDPGGRDRVESHAASCPACQAEVAMQQRLARIVANTDEQVQAAQTNWAGIAARLGPAAPEPGKWLRRWHAVLNYPLVPLGGAVAAALVLMAMWGGWQGDTPYRTLTAPEAAAYEWRIRAVPGTTHGRLMRDLEAMGVTVSAESGPDSVIRAIPPDDPVARADALRRLTEDPRIALVNGAEE